MPAGMREAMFLSPLYYFIEPKNRSYLIPLA